MLASAYSTVPDNDFKRRFDLASSYFGDQFASYYVPSGGWIADREFVKMGPLGDPSADARQLAVMMSEGQTKLTKLAVYCPSPSKMAAIIRNATYINRNKHLPHLEVYCISATRILK